MSSPYQDDYLRLPVHTTFRVKMVQPNMCCVLTSALPTLFMSAGCTLSIRVPAPCRYMSAWCLSQTASVPQPSDQLTKIQQPASVAKLTLDPCIHACIHPFIPVTYCTVSTCLCTYYAQIRTHFQLPLNKCTATGTSSLSTASVQQCRSTKWVLCTYSS